ncbi:MAG: hypothetical protein NC131_17860 [Roseburia sp.]|nr:hypothetical protein [Roseburia sp.]
MAQPKTAATPTQNLIRFNVRNARYAFPTADGGWDKFAPFGTATKMALETDASTKDVYGDGKVIVHYNNEKGKTATLTLNNICNEYEIACGRKIMTADGLADIKPTKSTPHVVYFEIFEMNGDNEISVAKCMLYNATSTRPAESYDQNNGEINESTFDLPLTISGVPMLAADGKVYVDAKGNNVRVWQLVKTPEMDGYAEFGDEVVIPKMLAGTETNA